MRAMFASIALIFVFSAGASAEAPSGVQLDAKLDQAVVTNPEITTTTVGTDAANVITGDLASPPTGLNVADSVIQQILITNKSTTADLCFKTVAWASTCAASGITCSGASTDGQIILPRSQRVFRPAGPRRPCVAASAGATAYQAERVSR